MSRGGIVVTGPTGSGKTELSMRLADEMVRRGMPCEIVSADAVCIYKELDIGAAKPPAEFRARVRHHMIDIRSIADAAPAYSAGEFLRDFESVLPALPDPPVVVGGTSFYIDAIVRGLGVAPPADPAVRARLAAEEESAPGALFTRLHQLDPESARRIGPSNRRRIARALEVCELTGEKFSAQPRRAPPFRPLIVIVQPGRADLHRAIDERARLMFDGGLEDETADLLGRFHADLPVFSIIGYAEAARRVRGEISRATAVEETARRTRNLAKRQLTWWRHFRYEATCTVRRDSPAADILAKWKERHRCEDS